jgi:hypothetical protein
VAQVSNTCAQIASSEEDYFVMKFVVLAALLGSLAAACSALPDRPQAGADPSDPHARVSAVAYRSTIGPYVSQRPVEPKSWQQQNERAAPAPRQ